MTDASVQRLGFDTRVIHAGQAPDPSTGAIMPPIYATSTYVQQSPGVHKGLDYGRSHNPTRWALERCVADLESGAQAFAFASGMAAIATVLELLDAGAHVVAGDDLYGGTYRLFERVRRRSAGQDFSFVDLSRAGCARRGAAPGDGDGVGGDAEQSAAEARRPRSDRADSAARAASCASPTTRSRARGCSGRSSSASTSSCTRRRST